MRLDDFCRRHETFAAAAKSLGQSVVDDGIELLTRMHVEAVADAHVDRLIDALVESGILRRIEGFRHTDRRCDYWQSGAAPDGETNCQGCSYPLERSAAEDRFEWSADLPEPTLLRPSAMNVAQFFGDVHGLSLNQGSGTQVMTGDNYTISGGNNAGIGPNSTGTIHNAVNNVAASDFIGSLDINAVRRELNDVFAVAKTEAETEEDVTQAAAIAAARKSAESGDRNGVAEALSKGGEFIFDIAKRVGANLVVEIMKQHHMIP